MRTRNFGVKIHNVREARTREEAGKPGRHECDNPATGGFRETLGSSGKTFRGREI